MENFNQQGRKQSQYEDSAKTLFYGCIGMLGVIVSMIIYGILF